MKIAVFGAGYVGLVTGACFADLGHDVVVRDIVGAKVDQPSCFIGGALDPVRAMVPGGDLFADPGASCTDFRGKTIVGGAKLVEFLSDDSPCVSY